MPKYKLLVTDLDGTVVDKNGRVSEEDKRALAEARRVGIQVSVCTGRAAQASANVLSQLNLDGYHIFFDGAVVCRTDGSDAVYADPISKDLVREMGEYMERIQVNMDMYSAGRYFIQRVTWATEIRRTYFGLDPILTDFSTLWQREQIIKGTLLVRSDEERAMANEFIAHFKGRLFFSFTKNPAYPDVDFINVLAPGVSKGKALDALSAFLKIPLSEVVAAGDGVNDIPILEKAGLSIAMGDAPAAVKAAADYVTLDVDHNGLAAAIREYLL